MNKFNIVFLLNGIDFVSEYLILLMFFAEIIIFLFMCITNTSFEFKRILSLFLVTRKKQREIDALNLDDQKFVSIKRDISLDSFAIQRNAKAPARRHTRDGPSILKKVTDVPMAIRRDRAKSVGDKQANSRLPGSNIAIASLAASSPIISPITSPTTSPITSPTMSPITSPTTSNVQCRTPQPSTSSISMTSTSPFPAIVQRRPLPQLIPIQKGNAPPPGCSSTPRSTTSRFRPVTQMIINRLNLSQADPTLLPKSSKPDKTTIELNFNPLRVMGHMTLSESSDSSDGEMDSN